GDARAAQCRGKIGIDRAGAQALDIGRIQTSAGPTVQDRDEGLSRSLVNQKIGGIDVRAALSRTHHDTFARHVPPESHDVGWTLEIPGIDTVLDVSVIEQRRVQGKSVPARQGQEFQRKRQIAAKEVDTLADGTRIELENS